MTTMQTAGAESAIQAKKLETGNEEKKAVGPLKNLKRFLPLLIVGAGLAAGYAAGLHEFLTLEALGEQRETLRTYVDDNGFLAGAVFLVLYTLAVAFSFPAASILTIFGGFLFGWFTGGVLVAFGATMGATAIFLAAKSAFGDVLKKKAGPWAAKLADGFSKDAFNYLFVLRLAPVFPFFIMNIAPAFFDVKLRTYVVATFLGILPGTFAYAYLGEGIDSVLLAAAESGTSVSITDLVTPELTFAFAALAAVAAIPTIVRKVRGRGAAE